MSFVQSVDRSIVFYLQNVQNKSILHFSFVSNSIFFESKFIHKFLFWFSVCFSFNIVSSNLKKNFLLFVLSSNIANKFFARKIKTRKFKEKFQRNKNRMKKIPKWSHSISVNFHYESSSKRARKKSNQFHSRRKCCFRRWTWNQFWRCNDAVNAIRRSPALVWKVRAGKRTVYLAGSNMSPIGFGWGDFVEQNTQNVKHLRSFSLNSLKCFDFKFKFKFRIESNISFRLICLTTIILRFAHTIQPFNIRKLLKRSKN